MAFKLCVDTGTDTGVGFSPLAGNTSTRQIWHFRQTYPITLIRANPTHDSHLQLTSWAASYQLISLACRTFPYIVPLFTFLEQKMTQSNATFVLSPL
ncbi:hypothetical protein K443DRAFT_679513 [Laccaria amethystina LaAM-08-1]|uniref:Uncharacterized protein n=1 Tax=Laccaria amethystina LaAM-08-1 TaxID=1095629 RepID=A0A0C9XVS4_9AGAR|nr:hypothetical protein K443DRAFT_679513 [Laccaria amethystina LaAM-08-1]